MEPTTGMKAIQAVILLSLIKAVIPTSEQMLQVRDVLDHLKAKMEQQEDKIRQLQDEVQQQKDEIQQQKVEIQQQKGEIQQQKSEIQQQNNDIEQQQNEIHRLRDKLGSQIEVNDMLLQMMEANTESITLLEKRLGKNNSGTGTTFVNIESLGAEFKKNIVKRSDDSDPLEIVVSHVSQRVDDVTAEIQTLKTKDEMLASGVTEAKVSVYTRWGSSSCNNASDLIYTGVIGGSFYTHSGGAANPLCLPLNPVYAGNAHMAVTPGYAALYGAEYEVAPEAANNLDAVCAVCRTARASTVMIPATNVCSPGWAVEYSGYIMAGYPSDGRVGTEFICVDEKLEGRIGSTANDNGLVLYYTKSHCGSLPCPPFQEGKVVTCAVCSK